ncbi:MAG TPA: hypothetical protein VFI69_04980 [Candidatus Limnocylindrales bacterium]|nr:hypothetical protein [Candidatus Limnocylindrales bacterium]
MTRRTISLALIAGAMLIVTACGGATSSPAASASAAATASAAASTEPSVAASPSAAEASPSEGAISSDFPIPSFAFPSEDKELEALLPAKLCGADTLKFSMSGATFEATADPEFKSVLDRLGKSASDVSFAVAGGVAENACSAGIFRIKGADGTQFKNVFLEEAAKAGDTYSEKSVGGKTVLVGNSTDFQYAYFKGDALIFVAAPNPDLAAAALADLP